MEPNNQNPYDFILNDQPKKRSLRIPLKSNSTKGRIFVVLIALVVLLIGFFVVYGFLTKGSKTAAIELYKVAAAQQDLVGLTDIGINQSRDTKIINLSSSTKLIVSSQAVQTDKYVKSIGGKKSAKAVAKYRNSNYKKALDEAKSSGTFEEKYKALLFNSLDAYRVTLQSAYSTTSNQKLKELLNQNYIELSAIENQKQ